jgi:Secretion system C-terminal sorting domain
MRVFTLPILLALLFQVQMSAQEWQWAKSFGRLDIRNYQEIKAIAPWGENGVVGAAIMGSDLPFNVESVVVPASENMVAIFTFDSSGNILWGSFLATGEREYNLSIAGVQVDKWNNVYVAFSFLGLYCVIDRDTIYNQGSSDGLIVKLNSAGKVVWYRSLASSGDDAVTSLQMTAANEICVTGSESDGSGGNRRSYLKKINDKGTELWSLVINESAPNFSKLQSDEAGNIYVLGNANQSFSVKNVPVSIANEGYFHTFILKLDRNGKLLRSVLSQQYTESSCMHYVDGKIYFASSLYVENQYPSFAPGIKIERFSTNLAQEWMTSSEYSEDSFSYVNPTGLTVDKNGTISVIGSFSGEFKFGSYTISNPDRINPEPFRFNENIFLAHVNSDGEVLRLDRFGDRFHDQGNGITTLKDGRIAIGGFFSSDQLSFGDFALENTSDVFIYAQHSLVVYFKTVLAFMAVLDISNISTAPTQDKAPTFLLYPNPSQDYFYLRSEAFTENPVQIQIFSTDGKLLSQQNLLPNGNSLRVETAALPPGLYIVTTIANEQISSARFVKQ